MRKSWSNGLRLTDRQRRAGEQTLFNQEGNQQAQSHSQYKPDMHH